MSMTCLSLSHPTTFPVNPNLLPSIIIDGKFKYEMSQTIDSKLTEDIHVSFYTKSSGWNMKIQKKTLISYLSQSLLISQKQYSISILLIPTKLVHFYYYNSSLCQPLPCDTINFSLLTIFLLELISIYICSPLFFVLLNFFYQFSVRALRAQL